MTVPADSLLEPTGALIVELTAYLATHGYPQAKVRGGNLLPADLPGPADSGLATGLVVLARNGGTVDRRVPLQRPRYVATCYAAAGRLGPENAARLANTVVAWFHDRGPRVGSGRRPIFQSSVVSLGASGIDPDRLWPLEQVVISAVVATAALP